MLEAEKGVYFLDGWDLPEQPDYHIFFMAKGFGIRMNASIPGMTLCDEGPALTRLMGLDPGITDGHVAEGLLAD